MPVVSLLTWCPSEAEACLPAKSAVPVAPTILRNWRLLGLPMIIPLFRPVRELFGHHDPDTDGGAGRQTDHSGGERVRSLALLFQVHRRIAVKGGRLVDLDLVGNGGLEEQVRFGAADAGMADRYRPDACVIE